LGLGSQLTQNYHHTASSNPRCTASFSSRTGPIAENGLRFFEVFKGICEGDRTSETGERPKIGL